MFLVESLGTLTNKNVIYHGEIPRIGIENL